MKMYCRAGCVWLMMLCGLRAGAAVATFVASKDNTLFESATGALSNGQGPFLYVGKTGTTGGASLIRRAVMAFDLSSIPAGATVTDASLNLFVSRVIDATPTQINLHRLTKDWGEGASNAGNPGGSGTTAAAGDATWTENFHGVSQWANAGGDFNAAVSGSFTVEFSGTTYSATGAGLVADVQSWVNAPSGNFGWILTGDEVNQNSAKRFDSSEGLTAANYPSLSVTYSVPEPGVCALALMGGLVQFGRRRARRA